MPDLSAMARQSTRGRPGSEPQEPSIRRTSWSGWPPAGPGMNRRPCRSAATCAPVTRVATTVRNRRGTGGAATSTRTGRRYLCGRRWPPC